ncbi:TPA: HP1 family phage holin [Klebsiella pneumoniae]|uniref:HP1 family phage holin n=1 Tax=Klebsiella pneumoniae TaxID=573 RepID=UPI003752ECE7
MTLERISAFITYCIAVVLAWLGDLSIKDASTLGGLMIGVLMLAINWYYKHKAYQLLRDGKISREDYESINR